MMKYFLRLAFIILVASAKFAYAQTDASKEQPKQTEEQTPQTDTSTKEPAQEGTNFFDKVEAPVTYKGAFTKMILTLLGLIVLIVVSVWILRRISHGRLKQMNYGRAIKVLERRPLSSKTALYLVEISGKKVVIAESQIEVRTITTADHLTPEE